MKFNNFFIPFALCIMMQPNVSFGNQSNQSYWPNLFKLGGGLGAFLAVIYYMYNKPTISYADIINNIVVQKEQLELAVNKIIEAKNDYESAKKIAEDHPTTENIQREEDAKTKAIQTLSVANEISELLQKI